MNVGQLMTHNVRTCGPYDSMNIAAAIMWEKDCGCVPVVDENSRLVGVITDRDVCMAAYTQGQPLTDMQVASAMATNVFSAKRSDTMAAAEATMRTKQVHRLPVTDDEGRLVGILSLNDVAREAARERCDKRRAISADEVAVTLGAISEPRATEPLSAAA